ncbi:hypothetical protein ACWEOW_25025 [Monashia sp. NPDC004114]
MGRADSRNARVITTAAAVIAVVVLTGAQKSCDTHRSGGTSGSNQGSGSGSKARSSSSSAKSASSVRYSVTSDASIKSVTYINGNGDKVTRTNVGRTWSGSAPGDGRVMVQATLSSDGSWIKCSVKADNKVVQRASASGGGSVTVVCDATF